MQRKIKRKGNTTIMEKFTYNEQKAVASVLLVVNELSSIDRHKIAKILFFADQKHLARYGRTITSDFYCALEAGPVPSNIYDAIKVVAHEHNFYNHHGLEGKIEVRGREITPLAKPDIDQLSISDIECLIESINENSKLTYGQLIDKSHGSAWQSVPDNQIIPFTEIAKEASAPDEILELIIMNLQAEELLSL